MELFERVRFLSQSKKFPLAKIAENLGYSQQNFNKWFNVKTQRRLWEHLPKILELFPDVRPEWLYMGQEPAFRDGSQAEDFPTRDEVEALRAENKQLKAELAEADRVNRKLTAQIFIDGVGDKHEPENIGKVADGQG